MDANKLKEIIKAATEAVEDIENEELKKIAFQTALNTLLRDTNRPTSEENGDKQDYNKPTKKKRIKKIISQNPKESDDPETQKITKELNRTEYAEMDKLTTALNRSLYLLMIVKDKCNVDGLSSTQIITILSKTFRIKAKAPAISMALGKDTKYTDRKEIAVKGGKAFIYKIMNTGEEYIKEQISLIKNEVE